MIRTIIKLTKPSWTFAITILIGIISCLYVGCHSLSKSDFDPQISTNERPSELPLKGKINSLIGEDFENSHKLWLETKSTNYNMLISIFTTSYSSPAEPVMIEVREGKSILIKPASESDKRATGIYSDHDTIEKLFTMIETESEKGVTVKVKYNKELGYPENITFNYAKSGMFGGRNIEIKKFEIIK
jgi:Family of unknown function (DUF6174)